nr:hypothetical protein CFP56_03082 [Quercus suber]
MQHQPSQQHRGKSKHRRAQRHVARLRHHECPTSEPDSAYIQYDSTVDLPLVAMMSTGRCRSPGLAGKTCRTGLVLRFETGATATSVLLAAIQMTVSRIARKGHGRDTALQLTCLPKRRCHDLADHVIHVSSAAHPHGVMGHVET